MGLVQNAMYCELCKVFIVCQQNHLIVGCKHTKLDGGLEYQRVIGRRCKSYTLYEDSKTEEYVEKLLWGTMGKSGNGPLVYKLMKDLDKDHLKEILKLNITDYRQKVITELLK